MTFNDFTGTSIEPVLIELHQIAKDEGINDCRINYRNELHILELDWGESHGQYGGRIILPDCIGAVCQHLVEMSEAHFDNIFPFWHEDARKIFSIFRDKLKKNIFMQLCWY